MSVKPTVTSGSVPDRDRILHLIASGGLYGIERMLLGLLPALRRRSYAAALVCLNVRGSAAGRLGELAEAAGVPVHYAGSPGRFDPRALLRLEAVLRACRPRLIHVHGYKATILGGALGLARGIPTVATAHTEVRRTPGVAAYARMETQVIRRIRGIAAVSEAIRRELEERSVPADRIRVIPNGIPDGGFGGCADLSRFRGSDGPVLLYIGRLIREKNIHLLVGCLGRLRQEFPGIVLLVAGEGPFRPELEAQVDTLGLRDAVRFLGFVEDVYPLLGRSDCFVLPSQTEGVPIAILEAMSCAVPIVTTPVGSIPSMLRNGVDAILVQPGDADGLLAALRRLLGDGELRGRLGMGARARFGAEYTAERMAVEYAEFYELVLAGPGRG